MIAGEHRAPDALVERDGELELLRAAVADLPAGRSRVITVEGAPGTGRSALLRYAAARARAAGCAVAYAAGSPTESALPLGIVTQLLAGRDTPDAPDPAALPLPALCELFLTAARERPLLLAVDDAQWADAHSRRWLEALLRRARGAPLTIVVAGTRGAVPATRPGTDGRADGAPATARVVLRPLTPPGVAAMLAAAFDGPVDPAFASAAAEACAGNPAVLRAVVDGIGADGLEPSAHTAAELPWRAAESVGERTARLIDGLSAEHVSLLRAIAAGGPHLGPAALGELAGLRTVPVSRALSLLADAGLAEGADTPRTPPGVAEAALAGMTGPDRAALHARAAVLAPRAAVPAHRPAPPAGVCAPVGTGASDDDPDRDERAGWRLLNSPDDHVPAVDRLRAADLLATCGHGTTVRRGAALPRTLAHPDTREAEHDALLALHWLIEDAASTEESADIAARVPPLPVPPRGPAQEGVAALRGALAGSLPPALVRALAEAALRPAPGHPRLFTTRLAACYALALADSHEDAAAALDPIVAQARALGTRSALAATLAVRATVALRRGWLQEAEQDLAEVERAASQGSGSVKSVPLTAALRILLHLERDEVDEAGRAATAEVPVRAVSGMWWPTFLYARGRLGLRTGDHEAALSDLLECGRGLLARGWTNPSFVPWRSAAALARLGRGDRAGATRLAAGELEAARAWGSASAIGTALLAVGRVTEGERARAARGEAARLMLRGDTPAEWAAPRRARHVRALTGVHGTPTTPSGAEGRTPGPFPGPFPAVHGAEPVREELTAAETRAAGLVREGMTNGAIALRLGVSRRMVEMHLSRVYRKLGLSGRADLSRPLPDKD
ncbi:AAA family ATPase [Streptomyces sp. AB3(2024)]|uniref:AAA family ATPase n=1 Tax=Streptomyces sp. AB3(2024) TaxID=3317321 RepID=UPI0035A3B65F